MDPFGLVVRFVLKDGAGAAFDALMQATLEGIRAHEPGTLLYLVHEVEGEPAQRIFYELYADEEAFAAHGGQPHIEFFMSEREKYVASYTVDRVRPLTAKGIAASGGSDQ
jgi:quinol monooxygenase YgiN